MRIKGKPHIILTGILIGVILTLLNVLTSRFFARLDLTADQEYTLSTATKKILKSLDDPVTIKLFFTKKVPPNVTAAQDQISDLIDEYKRHAGSKINVEWIVPEASPQDEQAAQIMGIPPLQLNVIEADKQEVRKIYLGLALLYADKKEIIPVVTDLSDLEYQITSAILKLTTKQIPLLGLMLPEKEAIQGSGYEALKGTLSKQITLKTFSYDAKDLASSKLDGLLLVEPREVDAGFISQLDQLFSQGVPLMVLGGTVEVAPNLTAQNYRTGLEDWLAKKGMDISTQLLIDPRDPGRAAFSSGFIQYLIPYPFFVKLTKEGLNQENPVTRQLEALILPWTNTLTLKPEDHPEWKYTRLLTSSSNSFLQEGELKIDPQYLEQLQMQDGEHYTLGALLEVPGSQKSSRLVVIADNHFMRDNFLSDNPQNLLFVQNMVDWASWGEDLISIRSRGKTTRPLKPLSGTAITAIRASHVLLIPLAFIGIGLIASFLQKRRHRRAAEEFGG